MVTASNVSSANGSWVPSPAVKGRCGSCFLPTCSIPIEKSHGTTVAPASAKGWLDVPVPAARSRTLSPYDGSTAVRTSCRQRRSWPKDSTSLVMSYRFATASNIRRTSAGCLSSAARATPEL